MIAGPLAGLADPAAAQTAAGKAADQANTISEVVVQARRVSERLQDVPQSVTALSTRTVQDNHIQSVYDIKYLVPNLFESKTSTLGGGLLYIRGIVSQGLPNATLDTRVGIYVDGVYMARPEGINSSMADIAQIEVLKGPQGTLFGRNVTAGAINFITANPTGHFGGEADVGYGNYDQQRYRVTLNSPEWNGLSARITYSHDGMDGQIDNLAGGTQYGLAQNAMLGYYQGSKPAEKAVDGHKDDAVFFALRYTHEKFTADYKLDYSLNKENSQEIQAIGIFPGTGVGCEVAGYYLGLPIGGCLFGIPGEFAPPQTSPTIGVLGSYVNGVHVNNPVYDSPLSFSKNNPKDLDFSGGAVIRNWSNNLTLQYEVDPSFRIKNIASYRHLTANGQIDTDALNYRANPAYFNNLFLSPGNVVAGDNLCISCSYNRQSSQQISDELQFINKWGNAADSIIGFYYFNEHTSAQSYYLFNAVPNFTYFGQGIPPLAPGQPVYLNTGGFVNGEFEYFSSKSYAVFGHVTLHVTPKLDISGGLRFTTDHKIDHVPALIQEGLAGQGLLSLGTNPHVWYHRLTYDATVTYKVSPDINVYNRYATAYLAGGFFNSTGYVPEDSWSEEIGLKSEWLHHHLLFNAAGYYQSTSNSQQTGQSQGGGIFVANIAGTTINEGFEVDSQILPMKGVTLGASVGYTHLEYPCLQAYAGPSDAAVESGVCYKFLQTSPEWQTALNGQYDTPRFSNNMYLSFKIDAQYQSHFSNLLTTPGTPQFYSKTPSGQFIPFGGDFTQLNLTSPAAAMLGTSEYNYKALLTYLGYNMANPNAAFTQYTNAFAQATKGGGYWLVNIRATLADIPLASAKGRLSFYVNNLFNELGGTNGSNYGGYFGRTFEQYRTFGFDLQVKF
jgi:iron complex outermembrane receptor protein